MTGEAIVVLCTCPDDELAGRVAQELVSARLASCVSRLAGLRSVYRWQDALRDEPEVLLIIKSTRNRYAELELRLRALHPYEVPEIIALPVIAGLEAYLTWVAEETAAPAPDCP